MQLDDTTLSDLEVLTSSDGSPGVLAMLDRTATARGRAALRRRVTRPPSDLASIVATQVAVRFFADHPGLLSLQDAELVAVEQYVRSNLEVGAPARRWRDEIETAWLALRYRDVLRELRTGVRHTRAFFSRLQVSFEALRRRRPPPMISDLLEHVLEAAERVLRPELARRSVVGVDRHYRAEIGEQIRRALEALGELDALAAMGAFARTVPWVFPEWTESDTFELEAEGAFHPFLESGVQNPIRLSGGEPTVFLTGPNMAGKTTYLRTVGIIVLLAHAGFPVPAAAARLTTVDALFTSLNPTDNLRAGVSYFLAEIQRVRAAAELLVTGKRTLVLFDEVFKGTNVKDALEASAQVILGFARSRRSGFIFSSHLSELADVLRRDPSIRFQHFDGSIDGGAPKYSYRLQEGVSDKRFGMLLLRHAKIPELIEQLG
jgi:DNA mismatch repair protein MutS